MGYTTAAFAGILIHGFFQTNGAGKPHQVIQQGKLGIRLKLGQNSLVICFIQAADVINCVSGINSDCAVTA